jgi:glycosyltransferase involved in cell wall biosynthesis
MRICIVTHTLVTTDGQGRINYEIARHLSRRGHELVLVSTTIDPTLAAMPNVTWHEVPIPKVPTAFLKYAAFARRAKNILKADTRGFDILQTNGNIVACPSDVNVAMFVHSNWIKSKYFMTFKEGGFYALYQNLFTRIHGYWERREFRRTRRAVALSDLTRNSLLADVHVPADKIEVIMPGVDVEQFRPGLEGEANPLRGLIGVGPDAFVIFFAGDLKSKRKNLDLILQAMSRLGPNFHVVCPGGLRNSSYPAIAESLGLKDRAHFIGHRTDLGVLFRAANTFAFPSHYDTFALVLTEAMATGLPVITAPSVGAASFIEPGVNGILLRDSNDLDGLVAALKKFDTDRDYAKQLGSAARASAEKWTWQDMALRYESLYQRIVAEKIAPGVIASPRGTQAVVGL